MGQSEKDEHKEEESGSGDSLFITQKPVPEAVRSRRRRNVNPRSKLTSLKDLEESEDDSFTSDEEPKAFNKLKHKKPELPKYAFPFLSSRRGSPRGTLLPVQNRTLHKFVMGGFFKCVRELWGDCQREDDTDSLPTLEMDGDDISPLSEAEETSDEDIRVVDNTCFVEPSKGKSQRAWCSRLTQQSRWEVGHAEHKTSPGAESRASDKTSSEASFQSDAPLPQYALSSDDGGSSWDVPMEKKKGVLAPYKKQKTKTHQTYKRTLFQQKSREEDLCSINDAIANVQQKPKKHRQKGSGATTEPQSDALKMDNRSQMSVIEDKPESQNLNSLPDLFGNAYNNSVCNETVNIRKKKRRRRDPESVAKANDQEEPDDRYVAKSVSERVQEAPILSEDSRPELSAKALNESSGVKNFSCNSDVIAEGMPNSKHRKKKKKSSSEHFRQEVDRSLESYVRTEESGFSVGCNLENIGKKKRKRDGNAECLNDAEIPMKKRKKEVTVMFGEESEEKDASNATSDLPPMSTEQFHESSATLDSPAPFRETLEPSYVKIKRHRKKRLTPLDVVLDGEECVDVNFHNDPEILTESERPFKKKKKRKYKDIDQAESAPDPLDNSAFIPAQKKKRKKEETVPCVEKSEVKMALNRTSDSLLMPKEQFEESRIELQVFAVSETLQQSYSKRKKQKMSSPNVTGDADHGVEKCFVNDVTSKKLKKKKKTLFSSEASLSNC